MHYHILLTERCNLQCKYCYEKSFKEFDNNLDKRFKFDFFAPESTEVDVHKLKKFLDKDKNATLIFYGGEPLLEIPKIIEIMDNMDLPFRMQTNGRLLHKLPVKYLKRIGKILISIDGDKKRTDHNKGQGVYETIIKNLNRARRDGYRGEFVARMTISPDISASDLYEQVLHLVKLIDEGIFDSIHWQIDAGFYKFDFNKENFEKFISEYNLSLEKLVNWWLCELKKGKVYKIYPFIAIIDSLLKKEKTKLRCGAGYEGYAISTNGKIVACPIMNSIVDFEAGSITDNPNTLLKFEVPGCKNCNYLDLCGGRCSYWRNAKLWPNEGDNLICSSIKFYLDKLKSILPEIEKLIQNKVISSEDFEYEKYFGPEIIP